mgnify:CR=1 FL=1
MTINRPDLIKQLTEKHNYTKKAATTLVDDFCEIITDNLEMGNTVNIYGFGTFDLIERAARSCPNPQTGERVDIPAHWIPRFYPGGRVKRAVKLWEDNNKRGLV